MRERRIRNRISGAVSCQGIRVRFGESYERE